MRVRKSGQPDQVRLIVAEELVRAEHALRAVETNQETIVSIYEELQELRQRDNDFAEALAAIDANQRFIADAIGGLRAELEPRTALGRLLKRLLTGEENASERS